MFIFTPRFVFYYKGCVALHRITIERATVKANKTLVRPMFSSKVYLWKGTSQLYCNWTLVIKLENILNKVLFQVFQSYDQSDLLKTEIRGNSVSQISGKNLPFSA